MTSRRDFIRTGTVAGLALAHGAQPLGAMKRAARSATSTHPLRILILGGTSFLGPHQVAYALSRGHSVSTFTRGRTVPTVHRAAFEHVERLIGDRENDLDALRDRTWDAVLDNSGRRVAWTRDSADLLRDAVDVYLYTSSTGVYYPYRGSDIREDTQLVLAHPDGVSEGDSGEYDFGIMKANSEIEARRAFGNDRTIVVRPTYMMGPADTTNRFAHWPVRLAKGGEVMVPGNADDPVQYIDVRDIAEWQVRLVERRTAGTFNGVGPASATGMQRFIHGAHAAFGSRATFVPVTDYDFLREHRVSYALPWIMPLGDNAGSARVSNEAAMANGLTFRPLADTIRDVHEWWHSEAVTDERRESVASGERSLMVREAEILEAWKAR